MPARILAFPMSAVPKRFGAALASARRSKGWTQQRLADEAGLVRETISRLERGPRPPVGETVFRLEAALGLEPGELVPDWPEWNPIGAMTHGSRSRRRRRELGLTLADVAAAAGVSAPTLSRFEREVGVTRALARYVTDGGLLVVAELTSDAYARALGFGDAGEHDRYCRELE